MVKHDSTFCLQAKGKAHEIRTIQKYKHADTKKIKQQKKQGHTLSGVVLGFCLPWWQTFIMLVVWEILERDWTVGLGDGESDINQLVDVIVAIVGWWLVILIFPRSRRDIPWISSRNSCGNEGKCCYEVSTHIQQSSQSGAAGYSYGAHV